MPAIDDLLTDFDRRGIRLVPQPPRLLVEPASRLTDADREHIRSLKGDLLAVLTRITDERSEAEESGTANGIDFLACLQTGRSAQTAQPTSNAGVPLQDPSWSILETCREHGVALRIDECGDLVVGKAGARADERTQPWPALLAEIEAHLEPVARLVEAGWLLKAESFPKAAA